MPVATPCTAESSIFPCYAALSTPFPAKKMAGRGVSWIVDGVVIPNFQTIDSSGGEAEQIDVTTHDTPGRYRENRPSFATEIQLTSNIIYDPTAPAHQWLAYLFQTGQVVPQVIQIWNQELESPGEAILFNGFISAFPMPSFPIDGPYDLAVQITASGDIIFPGMDMTPDPGPVNSAFRGCPGVWMPSESPPPSEADLAVMDPDCPGFPLIKPYPLNAWSEQSFIVTSDPANVTWDGAAWVPWVEPT